MSEHLETALMKLSNAQAAADAGGDPKRIIGTVIQAVNSLAAAVQLLERKNSQ